MDKKKPTRYYSSRQERLIAKKLGGKTVANSGAARFCGGDVSTDQFLIECKTATKPQESFRIQKEWLTKIKEEAFSKRRPYYALVFNFGGEREKENFAIIPMKLFEELKNHLSELGE